jgi:hypothetical protein
VQCLARFQKGTVVSHPKLFYPCLIYNYLIALQFDPFAACCRFLYLILAGLVLGYNYLITLQRVVDSSIYLRPLLRVWCLALAREVGCAWVDRRGFLPRFRQRQCVPQEFGGNSALRASCAKPRACWFLLVVNSTLVFLKAYLQSGPNLIVTQFGS